MLSAYLPPVTNHKFIFFPFQGKNVGWPVNQKI